MGILNWIDENIKLHNPVLFKIYNIKVENFSLEKFINVNYRCRRLQQIGLFDARNMQKYLKNERSPNKRLEYTH